MTKYSVTKKFVSGVFNGWTITETTSVKFVIGKKYKSIAKSSYIILDCVEIK